MEEIRKLESKVRRILASQAFMWLSNAVNRSQPPDRTIANHEDGETPSDDAAGQTPADRRSSDE